MNELYSLLGTSVLFSQIPEHELSLLIEWLAPTEKQYSRGQHLVLCGYSYNEFGFLLDGELEGIKPLADGKQLPVGHFLPGSVFGDILAFSGRLSPVNITALQPSRVLYFSYDSLRRLGCPVPNAQVIFLQNLLSFASGKYFDLNRQLDLLLIKSLRSRICAFLLEEARQAHSNTFRIRFNRVQLAEYLCCDRSALCRELSRMQKEGILELYKSSFRLFHPEKMQQTQF